MWAQNGAGEDQIWMIQSAGLVWVEQILFDLLLLTACASTP